MSTTVTVVIPCFTEARWDDLTRAIDSALAQTYPCQVIVAVDHNDVLLERLRRAFGERARVVANRYAQGASGGRNTGAELADTDLVVFVDDDEVADPAWVANLVRAHREAPFAVGLGGAVEARWPGGRPRWFPEEFSWTVGGTPPHAEGTDVRNVWGGNMAVRRTAFLDAGGFVNEFGKVGHASQPEDTELCLRMNARAGTGARWRFVPGAVVWHEVPPERSTFRFFLRRNRLEGSGKRVMSALCTESDQLLTEELAFVRKALTRGLLRNVAAGLRGDLWGPVRAAVTVLGVAAAGIGYVEAALRAPRPDRTAAGAPTLPVGDIPVPDPAREETTA